MAKKKAPPKADPRKTTSVQFRVAKITKAKIRARAQLYSGGNMSAWAEYCFENAPPRKIV